MELFEWRRDECRCYLFGHRLHHGAVGVLVALAGAWAMFSDRRDFPWLRD